MLLRYIFVYSSNNVGCERTQRIPLDTGMPYIKMYFLFKMAFQNDKNQHTLMYELTTVFSKQ